ncbi:MAG: M24 family metallopeptidase [Chitinophagaceae bacterium]
MGIKRRDFLNLSAMAAATGVVSAFSACTSDKQPAVSNESSGPIQSMIKDVVPISVQEREVRIEKAQRLMIDQNIKALVLDAGTSLRYFTGISWGQSERTMVAIIPAKGSVKYICPGFEEDRFRELITIGKDVYAWQEDESPYKLIVKALKDSGIVAGTIGMEERMRYFIFDGIRKEVPQLNFVSGDPISIPCRLIKSAAELMLMQKANDVTVAAIKAGINGLQEGMSPGDVAAIISTAHRQAGNSSGGGLVLFGEASAFPHGTTKPQKLKKGDIVLMDCGCQVEGYSSDITRTVVFGAEPTKRQTEIWNLELQSQLSGFAAAKIGAACEEVDTAARKVITDASFGPDYKLPGLPHRTGHGIGMDGHEWGNMVKGNKLVLQKGMCFSIEPTIAIPGEFGVRLEDCVYMTDEGPKWFTFTSKTISEPFG